MVLFNSKNDASSAQPSTESLRQNTLASHFHPASDVRVLPPVRMGMHRTLGTGAIYRQSESTLGWTSAGFHFLEHSFLLQSPVQNGGLS